MPVTPVERDRELTGTLPRNDPLSQMEAAGIPRTANAPPDTGIVDTPLAGSGQEVKKSPTITKTSMDAFNPQPSGGMEAFNPQPGPMDAFNPQTGPMDAFNPSTVPQDAINPNPPAYQQRLAQGSELYKHIKALSDQRGNIDPDIKRAAEGAWGAIAGGFSDSHSDDFWSRLMAPTRIGKGIVAGAMILPSAVQSKVGRGIESLTGGLLTAADFDTAMMGLSAKGAMDVFAPHLDNIVTAAQLAEGSALKDRMVNPLVQDQDGVHTRIENGPNGEMQGHPVGTFPPKPDDFTNASRAIAASEGEQANIQKNMLAKWNDDGLHPSELSAEAARNPALKHDLSAATTPPSPLPPRPDPRFIKDWDDHFYRMAGSMQADKSWTLNFLDDLPAATKEFLNSEEAYKFLEGDPTAAITPQQGRALNEAMAPLRRMELAEFEEATKSQLPVQDYDPTYMHRMVKGKTPQIDYLTGEGEANPIYNGPGILNRKTSSLQQRKLFAVESATGERQIVAVSEGKLNVLKGGPSIEQEAPFKVGDAVTLKEGEAPWTLKQAFTREIEEATNVRYYKNALVNTLDNIVHLRAVNRAVYAIEQLRSTPEWEKYVTSDFVNAPKDWKTPQMPLFKNDRMDPKLANMIDDIWKLRSRDAVENVLNKINSFAVRSLFWTPVRHAMNAGAWWATERNWDWLKPSGWQSLAVDGAQAMREVVTQGPKYQELLREGAGMQYARVANQDFYRQMMQRAGIDMAKNAGEFAELAKNAGMSPVRLYNAIQDRSARSLWAMSDMFTMQRILELERKGMTTRAAIEEAEKIMPNYRVPHEILGSRAIQELYTNPKWFMFSRYHWGVMRAYANMAKDLAIGTAAQRTEAIGSIIVMGAMQLYLWPAVSALLDKVTGAENLKVPSPGFGILMSPLIGKAVNATPDLWPEYVKHYYNDDPSLLSALANLVPISPALKWGLETYPFNRYSYGGRHVVEPGDINAFTTDPMKYGARIAGQTLEHTAEAAFEPYSMINEAYRTGKPITQVILEHGFGVKNLTPEQETAKIRGQRYQAREAKGRAKRPAGPIEQMMGE